MADFAQSGSCGTPHEWLESLPVTAFIERDEEISAANDLARRFIGTSDSIKVDQVLLGAYPAAGDAGRQRFECLFAPPGSAARMVSGAVQPFPAAGDGARLVLLMEPLEEDAASVAGDDSIQRCGFLEELFDTASEAMVITQGDRILRANREFLRIFGYPKEACLGSNLFDLIVPEGRMHETEMMEHMIEAEGRATIETVRHTSSGEALDVSIVVMPVQLGAGRSGHAATYRDIRQEKQAQARLQHSALHDPLTGLANRVLFLDRLTLTMARLRRRPGRQLCRDLPRSRPLQAGQRHLGPCGGGHSSADGCRSSARLSAAAGHGGALWRGRVCAGAGRGRQHGGH